MNVTFLSQKYSASSGLCPPPPPLSQTTHDGDLGERTIESDRQLSISDQKIPKTISFLQFLKSLDLVDNIHEAFWIFFYNYLLKDSNEHRFMQNWRVGGETDNGIVILLQSYIYFFPRYKFEHFLTQKRYQPSPSTELKLSSE